MTTPSATWRPVVPFLLLGAAACGASNPELFATDAGSAVFAIAGLDDRVTALEYVVNDRAGERVLGDSFSPGPGPAIQFSLYLPAADYAMTLTAHTADGRTCSGTSQFNVAPRQRVDIDVELQCSGGSGATITGTLVDCPSVTIAAGDTTLDVGASLVLATSGDATLTATPVWAASAGDMASADGVTRFTCTAPGDVEVSLSLGAADCGTMDSVLVTCVEPAAASACDGLGRTCHIVDATSAAAHECHELGHRGDEAACATGRAACVDTCGTALCTELASLCHDVDPGSGPLHECHELGHAADAAACFAGGRECFELCTRAHYQPVTLQFAAQVGSAPFACGTSYDGVGSTAVSVEPQDFRFFVHDIRLLGADAAEVPVEIEERAPWQALGAALLDFEDGTGACLSGDAATNAQITGLVPRGEYTGITFRIGVPESENHENPALQPAPLAAGSMTWGWLSGYKFLRAELGVEAGASVLHLGSTACSGDPAAGSVACTRPNRPSITLVDFDMANDVIVADIAALFAATDASASTLCHSSGDSCEPLFERLGVDLANGASDGSQSVFRVGP